MDERVGSLATADLVRGRRSVDRWFYIGMALAMIVAAVLGFGPSLVNTETRHAPLTMLATIHSALYGAWLIGFVAQTMFCGNATHLGASSTRSGLHHARPGAIGITCSPQELSASILRTS